MVPGNLVSRFVYFIVREVSDGKVTSEDKDSRGLES